jgi:hypothetical protein
MDKNVPINIIFNLLAVLICISPPNTSCSILTVSHIKAWRFIFFKKGSGCRKNVVTASGSFFLLTGIRVLFKCLTSPLSLVLVEAQEAQEMVEFSQSFRCWQLVQESSSTFSTCNAQKEMALVFNGRKGKELVASNAVSCVDSRSVRASSAIEKKFRMETAAAQKETACRTSPSSLLRRKKKKKKGGANFTAIRVHLELQSDR